MVCQVVSNTILIGADLKRNFLILPSNAVVINVQTWRVYRTETAWGGGHYEGHILYKKELPALKTNHLEKSLLGGMPKNPGHEQHELSLFHSCHHARLQQS